MKKIALVGVVSNAGKKLEKDLLKVVKACEGLELVKIFLVESDSVDNTVAILEKLQSSRRNFSFVTLGKLSSDFPDRIDRIRHCRNVYVQEIREFTLGSKIDYVIVADLDGMQSGINVNGIQSSFIRDDWAAVLANQGCGYCDLLALRHRTWCPNDVISELRKLQAQIKTYSVKTFNLLKIFRRRLDLDRARVEVIYSRMWRIKKNADWIEVDSGFGGLGIYRAQIFENFDYSLTADDLNFESEHVAFSKRIRKSGGKIFINPRMTNNYFNTYNINRYFLIRQLRGLYWESKKFTKKFVISPSHYNSQ